MASFWIRVNARLADDAEVRAFGRTLFPGVPAWMATATACGLLTTLWGRIADDQEDGNLSGRDDDALEEWAKWRGEPGLFAQTFRALFTVDGMVRDWEEYQGPLIERRRKDRDRIAERRRLARLTDSPGDNGKSPHDSRGDTHADVGATVGATPEDVGKMSTCNENEDGHKQRTDLPDDGRGLSVAEVELRKLFTPEQWADVASFLLRRPSSTWARWCRELLKFIGPATGALPEDLAAACSDAQLVTPPVDSPIALSAFVVKRMQIRRRPPSTGQSPPLGGSRAPRGPQPRPAPVYDVSANAAADRRLTRDLGDDDA